MIEVNITVMDVLKDVKYLLSFKVCLLTLIFKVISYLDIMKKIARKSITLEKNAKISYASSSLLYM